MKKITTSKKSEKPLLSKNISTSKDIINNPEIKNLESIYVFLADNNSHNLITIEFLYNNDDYEILINNKIMNINGAEKSIFLKLVSAMIDNNSVLASELIKPFKLSKSQVPLKKQLQKAIYNIRNELPKLLNLEEDKKHELILTKRKTQYNKESSYRFYIPDIEVKGFIKDIKNLKNVVNFIKKLVSSNNDLYINEIIKNFNRLIELLKKEYQFYLPFIEDLEIFLKKYELFLRSQDKNIRDFSKLLDIFEEKFIDNTSSLLTNRVYQKAKVFLGCYYGYNFATNGEDKISQNLQKIYINNNNELKIKIISSYFKYYGDIKLEESFLFSNANLIEEKSFVHQVLNKPLSSESGIKFLLGSFTAFSVDRALCFGKIFLLRIDNILTETDYRAGYLKEASKNYLNKFFSSFFETYKNNTTRVKLPSSVDINMKMLKTEQNKGIDLEWFNSFLV